MQYKLKTYSKKLLADTLTPVNVYLKLRDVYAGSLLLESSDYHGHENSLSIICCDPIAGFRVQDETITTQFPDKLRNDVAITNRKQVQQALSDFSKQFVIE